MEATLSNPISVSKPELSRLFMQLPEAEQWRLLQDLVASEIELEDSTIRQLDDRMQGYLFVQDYVQNRAVRIEFARSSRHMHYLRDVAGSKNVWMDDEEFTQLVEENDPATLACFARSTRMKPHQLFYIEHKLAVHPHGHEMLATSYDTRITLKKALETQENSPEMPLMLLAEATVAHSGDDPRSLWRAYLNLKSLDLKMVRELLAEIDGSTSRLLRTSAPVGTSLH